MLTQETIEKVYAQRKSDGTGRRFTDHKDRKASSILPIDHPAVVNGSTRYPKRVATDDTLPDKLLKCGGNNRKIGKKILKGRWKGMRIYTLTLEERATCPSSCHHWRSCYGNKMNWSTRLPVTEKMLERLEDELRELNEKHPQGFVVRLHVLGDFNSIAYVMLWEMWLQEFPNLHVFGYTAWLQGSRIGRCVASLAMRDWDRFAVRTSNGVGAASALSVQSEQEAIDKAYIPCPAQTGKSAACVTCALCWQSRNPIAFIEHGSEA